MRGLSAEKQKWIVCQRMLDTKYSTVSGDVVLGAAMITYGGAFTEKYRKVLLKKWQQNCLKPNELQFSDDFSLVELFGDNFKIREWRQFDLPHDTVSTCNALIIDKTKQYCLLIDPQQ